MTAEMVGARVIVVKSGTDKSTGKDKGLKGVLSAVSKQCYYISCEKLVIDSSIPSSPTATNSQSSLEQLTTTTATTIEVATKDKESPPVNTLGHDDSIPDMVAKDEVADNKKSNRRNGDDIVWEDVIWVKKIIVKRVLKKSSVLAVMLPTPYKKPRRGREGEVQSAVDNRDKEQDQADGRVFLMHGVEHMQFVSYS